MEIFKNGFGAYTDDGDTIESEFSGFRFVATVHHDSDHGAPWVSKIELRLQAAATVNALASVGM